MVRTDEPSRFADAVYRYRWYATAILLALVVGLFGGGMRRIAAFSDRVAALADDPSKAEPQAFDPRSDIWFDPGDPALAAYTVLENQYIAEDYVFVGFEERSDPLGVFGTRSLEAIARLTERLEKVPYVRNVRSLTDNPWIRWGEIAPGEDGLVVGDLFENAPGTYSEQERLTRMIATLGAQRSAALVGEEKVRASIGAQASFDDFIGEPRLLRSVVSEDGRATAILVQLLRPKVTDEQLEEVFGDASESDREVGPVIHKSSVHSRAVVEMEKIIAEEKDYEMHFGGTPVMERHFQVVGQQDMAFVGLMFAMIALVLLAIYRRFAGMALPLLVVFATIFGMVGFIFLRGDLLNNLTAVSPTMMTTVGIADAVHLVTAYYLLRPRHGDKKELVTHVLRLNALPVFLTSVTTSVGFFSLTSSTIVPIRELGVAAGLGTLLAYLLSMTLVPALLSLLPVGPKTKEESDFMTDERHWSTRLVDRVLAGRTPMLAVTGVLFLLTLYGMSRVHFETDIRLMFGEDDPVTGDILWQGDTLGGGGDVELLFDSLPEAEAPAEVEQRLARLNDLRARSLGEPTASLSEAEKQELATLEQGAARRERLRIASNAEFLSQMDRFERRVMEEADGGDSPMRFITRVDSALDVLRKIHQVQNENRAAFYRVPTEQDVPEAARTPQVSYDDIAEETVVIPAQSASTMISQYYVQYENGAKPSENLSSLITPDRRGFRVTVRVDAGPSQQMLEAFARIRTILHEEFPMLAGSAEQVEAGQAFSTMTMTGKQYMFTNMFQRFSDTMVLSLSIALASITLLIGFVFRSPVLALVSLLPNVLPITLPLATLGLLGVAVDGPSVVVASVALGVCVDDTIHFLTKFTQARRQGATTEEALKQSFRLIGAALSWTSVALAVGFSVLTLGTFRPNVMTGYLGASMVLLAWVADFLLTPALLSFLGKQRPATSAVPVADAGAA